MEFGYTIDELREAADRGWSASAAVNEVTRHWLGQWSSALDLAGLHILAQGCNDVMHVASGAFRAEFWVDCPRHAVRHGELPPGRCVYRQTLNVGDDCTMTIVKEWIAPELAPVAP